MNRQSPSIHFTDHTHLFHFERFAQCNIRTTRTFGIMVWGIFLKVPQNRQYILGLTQGVLEENVGPFVHVIGVNVVLMYDNAHCCNNNRVSSSNYYWSFEVLIGKFRLQSYRACLRLSERSLRTCNNAPDKRDQVNEVPTCSAKGFTYFGSEIRKKSFARVEPLFLV